MFSASRHCYNEPSLTPLLQHAAVPMNPASPHCYNMLHYQWTQPHPTDTTCCSTNWLSLTPLLQWTQPQPTATTCCSTNETSLTPLLQHAAVPMNPASPHCYNMLQYQWTQPHPTATSCCSTNEPSLTPLLQHAAVVRHLVLPQQPQCNGHILDPSIIKGNTRTSLLVTCHFNDEILS